jgi:NitT/TauT family transport system ATP-binding protein
LHESASSEPVLTVANVSKQFVTRRSPEPLLVLNDVSFHVNPKELVAVTGPSGCGKTTLLKIITGLSSPDAGQIQLRGAVIKGPSPGLAIVFQDIRLLPWRTVQQNVEFALELSRHRRLRPEDRQAARNLIDAVGLTKFSGHYPHQLSGGMQQRVGVARALAKGPEIVLLDEPFSSLDAQTRLFMQDWFLRLQDQFQFSALLVTHDIDEAVYMASRCVVLTRGPGTVKSTVDVKLPEPRLEHDVRRDPDFGRYRSDLWDLLRYDAVNE